MRTYFIRIEICTNKQAVKVSAYFIVHVIKVVKVVNMHSNCWHSLQRIELIYVSYGIQTYIFEYNLINFTKMIVPQTYIFQEMFDTIMATHLGSLLHINRL